MISLFLAYFADLSIVIPTVIAIIRRDYFNTDIYKLIGIYGFLTLLRNVATFVMNQLGVYNIYIYNWHNLLEFILIAVIYRIAVKNPYFKFLAIGGIFIVICTALLDYNTLFNVRTKDFNQFSYNVSGFIAIVFILFYFYQLLKSLHVPKLTRYPLFWFSAGALLYYAGTIFSYIFIETTFNSTMELRQQYWMIDAVLSIVFSIFLCFSIRYMKPVNSK